MNDALREVDNLIVGGGPAGAMAAIELARAGRDVTLLERERGSHHKVCGEFLSAEAVGYLARAGISATELGAAPICFVRLSVGGKMVESALPFPALSLSRFALDEALLRAAAACGCNVVRGALVERLESESAWKATVSGGRAVRARTAVLATGKHDLRGWGRDAGRQGDLVGFKMHWRLAAAQTRELREWMDLFLFGGGYGGISLVEGEVANLCFVAKRETLRRLGGFRQVLNSAIEQLPRLKARLTGAEPLWDRPLAISPIPYGRLGGASEGLWRVGDQFAVIPSFTGDGMAIALHSGALAAHAIARGEPAEAFGAGLHAQLRGGMNLALWLSRAMVSAAGRALAVPALHLRPSAMQWIAERTRVPGFALLPEALITNCPQRA